MLRLPAYVQLEITDACNLRCKHCYHFNTDEMPRSQNLSDEQTILLVEKLIESQVYSLTITGGEPLTRFVLTGQAVEMAKKAGLFVSINSNLLLLTDEMLAHLSTNGLDSFLVSCPASDPEVFRQITRCGDYRRFRAKLLLLLESGISCLVNMVATQSNLHLVRSTALDLAKLGVERFAVTPASLNVGHPDFGGLLTASQTLALLEDLRWCVEELGLRVDMLEPLPKCFLPPWCWGEDYAFTRRACQAGRMSASISNTGDVRPCSHNPIVYGNLLTESLETIWGKMSIYRAGKDGVVPIICQYCPALTACNGACRTNALAVTGRLDQPERLTVGHITWPQRQPSEIAISDDFVVGFVGRVRWRKETAGNYSVTSRSNHTNLLVVNEELFNFICWLEKSLPLTVRELKGYCSDGSDREVLPTILRSLIKKDFIRVLSF